MRKWIVFCVAALCLAGTVSAQNSASALPLAFPSPSSASQRSSDDPLWLFGVGYDYQRCNLCGVDVNMNGVQTSVTRFLNDYFGVEGNLTATFGSTTSDVCGCVHFLTYTGGARIQWRGHKVEPWVHALFGGAYSRHTQGIAPASFNGIAILAGGGADIKVNPHFAVRGQFDYVPTHLIGLWQNSYSIGGGIVFGF